MRFPGMEVPEPSSSPRNLSQSRSARRRRPAAYASRAPRPTTVYLSASTRQRGLAEVAAAREVLRAIGQSDSTDRSPAAWNRAASKRVQDCLRSASTAS